MKECVTTHLSSSLRIVCYFLFALSSRQALLVELLLELSNHANRPSIIPHDRPTQRLSRLLVPAQRRLSLVRNTDTLDARRRESQEFELFHGPGDAFLDAVDEVLRFMFVPVWVRVVLCVFGLVFADDFGILVKDDKSSRAAGGSAESARCSHGSEIATSALPSVKRPNSEESVQDCPLAGGPAQSRYFTFTDAFSKKRRPFLLLMLSLLF